MYEEMVNVSDLNQYLYCPRRYWYLHFYDTQKENFYKIDGKLKHENKAQRGSWTNEIYIESEKLGLKGKVDVLDEKSSATIPIERKRGENYGYNDEIQLAGYCMLLSKNTGEKIREGAIYLYETDQRIHIVITEDHKAEVFKIVTKITSMSPGEPPPFTNNPAKCEKCSTRKYCMPKESKTLGETSDRFK